MIPIGIDLGTTRSSIAKWDVTAGYTGSKTLTLPIEGNTQLPSKIFISDENEIVCGGPAIGYGQLHPDNFFSAFKRGMDENEPYQNINGDNITPVYLSSEIIKYLLKVAESIQAPNTFVPEAVVVSVPYYFKQTQNINTTSAVLTALKELYKERVPNADTDKLFLQLIPEPVAAGLDYAFTSPVGAQGTYLVFDLGGGTFDVTVYNYSQYSYQESGTDKVGVKFEVLSIGGDDRLGGEDFDESLLKYVLNSQGITDEIIQNDPKKKHILKSLIPKITECKQTLSHVNTNQLIVPYFFNGSALDMSVSRKDFERCMTGDDGNCIDYIAKLENIVKNTVRDAGLDKADITNVLLIGGSSQIPIVKNMLEQLFSSDRILVGDLADGVAKGAALMAAYLKDLDNNKRGKKYLNKWDKIEITERTAHDIGIVTNSGLNIVIVHNSVAPASGSKTYRPVGLSSDGKSVLLPVLSVGQGTFSKYKVIGDIPLPTIYTHNRTLEEIFINVNLISDSTMVKAKIFVKGGDSDGGDINIEETISLI